MAGYGTGGGQVDRSSGLAYTPFLVRYGNNFAQRTNTETGLLFHVEQGTLRRQNTQAPLAHTIWKRVRNFLIEHQTSSFDEAIVQGLCLALIQDQSSS